MPKHKKRDSNRVRQKTKPKKSSRTANREPKLGGQNWKKLSKNRPPIGHRK